MAEARWLGPLAAAIGVATGMWACGAFSVKPDDGNTSTGSGGAGGHSSTSTQGGGVTVGVGGSGGASCGPSCSVDLKQVLDCFGQVTETCGLDEACLDGSCSNDPCAAADAARTHYGCDYWAVRPEALNDGNYGCFAAIVANTWEVPVHITVSRAGTAFTDTSFIRIPHGQGQAISYDPYDPTLGLPVGEVAILFLSHRQAEADVPKCPVPPALIPEPPLIGTGRGQAFAITTHRPVVAYSMWPYGAGDAAFSSASLLLPASAWDTNYLAINPYKNMDAWYVPSLAILARQDGTNVTILPKAAIIGGNGVAYAPADTPVSYALSAGEYLQLSQWAELTGSAIQANKPIGVWGAANCFQVPVGFGACDSAHQQLPPIRALGSRYAGIRYRNRLVANGEEAPPWRLVGAVDGTQLSWKPTIPVNAPSTLERGEVAEFWASGPFVVESQDDEYPFYLAQYMTGSEYINPSLDPPVGEGDPEWVNVIPTEQFLERYVFFTDPTFPETSLVVVRRKSLNAQHFGDVVLDCAGTLGGWQSLGDDLEYTRVDLVTGDFESVNGCDNGRHEITSTQPFGVTVWGWGGYAQSVGSQNNSYAYPAGASLRSINEVVVLPTPE